MKKGIELLAVGLSLCLGGANAISQPVAWICVYLLAMPSFAQLGQSYDALVQQGRTQLQSGNNDAALASANAAIKVSANRWEAFAIAGAALMNLKRYEDAADDLSRAIDFAPEALRGELRNLRKQCLLADTEAPSASASDATTAAAPAAGGPSFAETAKWIENHIAESGFPAQTVTTNPFTYGYADAPYSVRFEGCTMLLSLFEHVHGTNTRPDPGDQSDWQESRYMKFKLPLDKLISVQDGGTLPLQDWEKNTINNGYRDQYTSGRFPAVAIILPDVGAGTASWGSATTFAGAGPEPAPTNDKPIKAGSVTAVVGFGVNATRNAILLSYARPDTEDDPKHMAKALQHLVDLCHQSPNAAPKDIF